MLPLFRRSVGFFLKIQLQHCNPAYQLLHEKPSQNPICTLQNHPGWLVFCSLTSSCPETSHHQGDLKDVDHMVAVVHQPLGQQGGLMGRGI